MYVWDEGGMREGGGRERGEGFKKENDASFLYSYKSDTVYVCTCACQFKWMAAVVGVVSNIHSTRYIHCTVHNMTMCSKYVLVSENCSPWTPIIARCCCCYHTSGWDTGIYLTTLFMFRAIHWLVWIPECGCQGGFVWVGLTFCKYLQLLYFETVCMYWQIILGLHNIDNRYVLINLEQSAGIPCHLLWT